MYIKTKQRCGTSWQSMVRERAEQHAASTANNWGHASGVGCPNSIEFKYLRLRAALVADVEARLIVCF